MPSKNSKKIYLPDMAYHVYNRGVNKGTIFFSKKDYWVFRNMARKKIRDLKSRISIECYALLPNHFHFLVQQTDASAMTQFMRSLSVSYTLYINRKYKRTGHLFQGVYKAALLPTIREKNSASRYILSNPVEAELNNWEHCGKQI